MPRLTELVLDLSGILDVETLHEVFYSKLQLFPEYGFYFDALWDRITDDDLSSMPQTLRIEGLADLLERLPGAHSKVVSCFQDYAKDFPDRTIVFENQSPSGFGLDVGNPIDKDI